MEELLADAIEVDGDCVDPDVAVEQGIGGAEVCFEGNQQLVSSNEGPVVKPLAEWTQDFDASDDDDDSREYYDY